jgi:hypothetical protein
MSSNHRKRRTVGPLRVSALRRCRLATIPAAKEDTHLSASALEGALRINTIVRRYRENPPLVRDAAAGWRTGRLELVLGGDFDLIGATHKQ